MNTTRRVSLAAGAAAAAFTFVGTPAGAQDGEVAQERESIMVTARRREESLQDVPIAITNYSGEALERIGAVDITAINETTPNVTLEVSRGTNSTLSAFIRGVGQQDPVAGFEAGVGIYVDDVYFNRPQAAVLDIFDVERIEVLRGPQGTLYGRNTIGGAVRYVTRRLDADRPTFNARVNVGNYAQFDTILSASAPLSDTFRLGGAIARLTHDGYGENLTTGQDNYNKDVWAGRISAEFEPNADWFFRFTFDHVDDGSNPRGGHRLIEDQFPPIDYPVLDDVFDTRGGLTGESSVEATGYAFHADWTINDQWTARNILSYRDDESISPIDFDALPEADVDVPVIYTNEQFSEEFQLLYDGERLSGVFGAYYLDANAYNIFDVLLAPTGDLIGIPGLNAQTLGDVDTETWSLFADFTYDLTPQWSVSLGGRYTYDERTARILRTTFSGGFSETFGGAGVPIATTSDFNASNDWTDFSPRASISFQPNDTHNIYFTYSQGFKGGGFDPRGQTTATPDFDLDGVVSDEEIYDFLAFDPEEVATFELGWKVETGAYRHALAFFYSDYTDIQVPGSVGVDTDGDGVFDTFAGITTNAGAATIWGVEYEGDLMLAEDLFTGGDDLSLQWAVGYLNGEYDEFIDAFGVDISNEVSIQNTPDWTASATLNYVTPFAGGDLALINTLAYRGDSQQFERPQPIDQDAFTLWNASVVWDSDDGRWQLGLHGRNLTDEEYRVAGYDFVTYSSLGLEGVLSGFYGPPRTVTATAAFRY